MFDDLLNTGAKVFITSQSSESPFCELYAAIFQCPASRSSHKEVGRMCRLWRKAEIKPQTINLGENQVRLSLHL